MERPAEGDPAPDFTLPDQHGREHALSDYRGQWVLLYFYPKDDTPGCTKEACGIRDHWEHFEDLDTVVLGVSPDSVASHREFAEKYDLPFTLLADAGRKVVNQYGVWGTATVDGEEMETTHRVSFLVDPEGEIARVYGDVDPEAHATEVITDRAELGVV